MLDTLVGHGTTILLTTQYLDEAERLADDIVVVDHGRIIAQGDARRLKREVGGDHLQVVLSSRDGLERATEILTRATGAQPAVDEDDRTARGTHPQRAWTPWWRSAAPCRRPASRSTTSACANPRWTRCSSP